MSEITTDVFIMVRLDNPEYNRPRQEFDSPQNGVFQLFCTVLTKIDKYRLICMDRAVFLSWYNTGVSKINDLDNRLRQIGIYLRDN